MPSPESGLTVAIDIGGTFTDIALHDRASGEVWRAKTPSVPADPSQAFLAGVRLALEKAGRDARDLQRVLHGTTVATNMILENKGAKAALITTRGFRHVLDIGRQDIPRRANLYAWIKPSRPVPPARIFEVGERVAAGGAVIEALDEASVREAAAACRRLKVEAVGVCLLHAFANPAHERRVAEILREELRGVAITAATDVMPVAREFERSLATALNAVVMPGVSTYVSRLETRLRDEKVDAPLLLMQSNGGVAGAATIRHAPVLTALSGPAAGVVGAREMGAACGVDNIITVDIGGTSADICLIKGGKIGLTQHGHVGEWPLPLPMVDMVTIGAGGGSIARMKDGALNVGPQSAGADPGPAAYGKGGREATVTDCHVVLGHLPDSLLDGRVALDVEAARAVVRERIAEPLNLSIEAAARGALAIIDNHMVGALRVVSVERGHDPRDFALAPFGGAGPLHACSLAALLGVKRVIIPPAPGVLCADGLLAADLKAEFSRTLAHAGAVNIEESERVFAELQAQADAWLDEERVTDAQRHFARVALMRYHGQGGEVATAWSHDVERSFVELHKSLYGFTLDAAIECVTLRIEAAGRMPAPAPRLLTPGSGAKEYGRRKVHFETASVEAPLYDRAALGAGDRFSGPAIVTQLDATTLVRPGWSVVTHESGSLLMTAPDA